MMDTGKHKQVNAPTILVLSNLVSEIELHWRKKNGKKFRAIKTIIPIDRWAKRDCGGGGGSCDYIIQCGNSIICFSVYC